MNCISKNIYKKIEYIISAFLLMLFPFAGGCSSPAGSGSDTVLPLLALAGSVSAGSGSGACADYDYGLPSHIPRPPEQETNCTTEEKVNLGRHLFYDKRLSVNETKSCSSCHRQEFAFTDRLSRSVGALGHVHRKNAQALFNAAYHQFYNWATEVPTLEEQALAPMFLEYNETEGTIVELGLTGIDLAERLDAVTDPDYRTLFKKAFPESGDEASVLYRSENIRKALASFQRTLMSFNSDYDRGNLSPAAYRGLTLFDTEQSECFHCHGGYNFADTALHFETPRPHHNNAIYSQADYQNPDIAGKKGQRGLYDDTGNQEDEGKFRAPSLRNIARTFPYMHDGSYDCEPPSPANSMNYSFDITSCGSDDDLRARFMLTHVVRHYANGGTKYPDGSARTLHPNVDITNFPRPGSMSEAEISDMVEFLMSLTDTEFLTNPAFSNPRPSDDKFGP